MLQLAEHQDVIDKQSLQQLHPRASPTYLISVSWLLDVGESLLADLGSEILPLPPVRRGQ